MPAPTARPVPRRHPAPSALVLGARGAVGRATVAELRRLGAEVTTAGRSAPEPDGLALDVRTAEGRTALRAAAESFDVVINASGVEDPRLVDATAGTILVDISATAAVLARMAATFADTEAGSRGLVLGAGIAPGLTTLLVDGLDPAPGDEIDVAIMLGGGEVHGPAAVAWTAELAGRPLHEPGEVGNGPNGEILNFRSSLHVPEPFGSRRYVRADFPDHVLLGAPRGALVRSWLATDSRVSTAALGVVGRFPALRSLVARAPHLGTSAWSITAIDRGTGRTLRARGEGQSRTTGVLTAHAALAAADRGLRDLATTADLLPLAAVDGLADLRLETPDPVATPST